MGGTELVADNNWGHRELGKTCTCQALNVGKIQYEKAASL
jgi:hypothetical protein